MAKLEAAATLGVLALIGGVTYLIYKNWSGIAETVMTPFNFVAQGGNQVATDVNSFPEKVSGAISGAGDPCGYLEGFAFNVPYQACSAVYGVIV